MFSRFTFVRRWYDFYIGFYWHRAELQLYIFPLPCLGVRINFKRRCGVCGEKDWPDLMIPPHRNLGKWLDYWTCRECSDARTEAIAHELERQ